MGLDQSINAQALAIADTRTPTLAQSILTALQAIQPSLLNTVADARTASLPFLTLASVEAWIQPYVRDLYVNSFQISALSLLQTNNLSL